MKHSINKLMLAVLLLSIIACSNTSFGISKDLQMSTAEPVYKTLEESKDSFSDGILLITIQEKVPECYQTSTPIPIILTFKNLRNKSLLLRTNFLVSKKRFGTVENIYVWLDMSNGQPLLSPGDTIFEHFYYETPIPEKYQVLDGSSSLVVEINYEIPNLVMINDLEEEHDYFKPSPGQYLIRIVYQNLDISQPNEWRGMIASNQLDICVIN